MTARNGCQDKSKQINNRDANVAIIGATGRTGGQILELLAKDPTNTIKVYARSRKKLETLFPAIIQLKNIEIYAGSIEDIDLLSQCVTEASLIFTTVAPQSNDPRSHIVLTTAQSVVAAVSRIRVRDLKAISPHIIALSSATINPTFNRFTPRIVHFLLTTSMCNKYADLSAMEAFLQSQQSWLHVSFVQPGGLVEDTAKGFELSLDRTKSFLSIVDLAAGMVEVASTGAMYDGKAVSVVPTGKDVPFNKRVPVEFLKGYCWRVAPVLCRKFS